VASPSLRSYYEVSIVAHIYQCGKMAGRRGDIGKIFWAHGGCSPLASGFLHTTFREFIIPHSWVNKGKVNGVLVTSGLRGGS
jgi:hypothetical protein